MTSRISGHTAMLLLIGSIASPAILADAEPLPQQASAELSPGEGHLVIVFDSLNRILNTRFVGSAGGATTFTHDVIEPGINLFTYRLPAGVYCMHNMHAGTLRYTRKDKRNLRSGFCVTVREGGLTYAGHWAPRATDKMNEAVIKIDFKPRDLLLRLKAEQPALLATHQTLHYGQRTDSAARADATAAFAAAAFEIGDQDLGVRLLERSASEGVSRAWTELGFRFANGDGLEQDLLRGLDYYERGAQAGDKVAASLACGAYLEDWRQTGDDAPARALCTQAAEAGDAHAAYLLVLMHRRSRAGLAPDAEQELAWLRKAAEQGHGPALFELGVSLRDGIGVAIDLEAARAAFEKAADEPLAREALGQMYERGLGVPVDLSLAAQHYEAALRGRAPQAAIAYARMLHEGRGVAADPTAAHDLLERYAKATRENALAYAWFLATVQVDDLRHGYRAVQHAQMALAGVERPRPEDLAILAAAEAEAGDFVRARATMQRVLGELSRRIAPDDPRLAVWRAQAEHYRAGKPWRE